MPTSFFRHRTFERLDRPHRSAHGDPWQSEDAYPEVFWWQSIWMAAVSWLPVPGIGSYYPHIYLALAAEYFFRSFTVVVLGIFVWSLFIEVPVYFVLHWYRLLPNNRSVWTQFVVYDKRNPTPEEVEKALSFKGKYEKPENGEYYAVFIARSSGLSPWGAFRAREDMVIETGRGRIKEVYGITYHRRDFGGYVLWAILLDIVLGILGAWIGSYLWASFGLESLRDEIDGVLVGEFFGLFFLIAHLASFWGWIFTPIAFGYIFILGAANLDQHVFSWTPYFVFFGVTAYYWIVFFRNPIPRWFRSPWTNPERNADAPELVQEIARAEPMEEHHFMERGGEHEEMEKGEMRRRKQGAPESVRETAAAEATVEEYSWSWWVFSSLNYDTFGYASWFGSMILLIIIATVALAL
jgi:uncharacterized membrane protein YeaQ/YmgE (transglycosylase-associated protein family)